MNVNPYCYRDDYVKYREIIEASEASGGEISESDSQYLAWFENQRDLLIDGEMRYVKNVRAHAAVIEAEAKAMIERANSLNIMADKTESRLGDIIDDLRQQGKTVKTAVGEIKFPWRGGAVEVLCSPEELPSEFQTVKITANKTEIGKLLEIDGRLSGLCIRTEKYRGVKIC